MSHLEFSLELGLKIRWIQPKYNLFSL